MASLDFYEQKIRERGHEVAAQYAVAAKQDQLGKMIGTGLWCKEHGEFVTPKVVTAVLKAHGTEAALTFARINPALGWVARKLEAGEWRVDYTPTNGDGAGVDQNKGRFENGRPQFLFKKPPPRIGKTARDGGKADSERRKKRRAEEDRLVRNRMKTAGGQKKEGRAHA